MACFVRGHEACLLARFVCERNHPRVPPSHNCDSQPFCGRLTVQDLQELTGAARGFFNWEARYEAAQVCGIGRTPQTCVVSYRDSQLLRKVAPLPRLSHKCWGLGIWRGGGGTLKSLASPAPRCRAPSGARTARPPTSQSDAPPVFAAEPRLW